VDHWFFFYREKAAGGALSFTALGAAKAEKSQTQLPDYWYD
jgi:hypothetical protein